ncbi:MAG: MarR family transcriptional regulator [Ignavibacteriaceae bacterium]|nr:MarR family transcriptional regulator [Ignavibacteriaceae bacterium]
MGTHFRGSKKEVTALDTFIKLTRASETLTMKLKLALDDYGLSEGQFAVLDALYHLGSLSQKDLGSRLLKSGGNITMVVDNLEKLDYVQRKRGKSDRRIFMIELTLKGRKKIEETLPAQVQLITKMLSTLSKREQRDLQIHCKKLGKRNQS